MSTETEEYKMRIWANEMSDSSDILKGIDRFISIMNDQFGMIVTHKDIEVETVIHLGQPVYSKIFNTKIEEIGENVGRMPDGRVGYEGKDYFMIGRATLFSLVATVKKERLLTPSRIENTDISTKLTYDVSELLIGPSVVELIRSVTTLFERTPPGVDHSVKLLGCDEEYVKNYLLAVEHSRKVMEDAINGVNKTS